MVHLAMNSPTAPLRTLLWCIATLAIAVLAGATARAANVGISRMETTFHRGSDRFLRAAIDGFDYGREGWSVKPQVDKPQSAILVFKEPALCARLKTSLAFLSGQSGAYFQEFALSVTSDPNPTFQSEWVTLQPWLSYSTGTKLEMLPLGHLRSVGKAYMTAFVVESLVKPEPITALRIEVFPARSDGDSAEGFVGGNSDHDFLLTEVRVQSFEMDSSNVALGAPARASHALWGNFRAEFLTDGLPSTFSHPRDPSLGEQFFFEIDFGKVRPLDHLSLRGRSDGIVPERLSNLQIELYEEPPDADTPPVWTATYRGDGSYPPIGSVEVLRAASG
ncbi:MAG: hypothetical protein RLZZ142_628, partial [Verrucomicrobiota bacterium]